MWVSSNIEKMQNILSHNFKRSFRVFNLDTLFEGFGYSFCFSKVIIQKFDFLMKFDERRTLISKII